MTTDEVLSVPLDTNSLEYQQVFAEFFLTAENVNITRIHRIQNPFRYRSYTLRKQKMEKDNCGANERQLFHGTAADSTAAINLQGFNRSYCGKNGKGSFSSISAYKNILLRREYDSAADLWTVCTTSSVEMKDTALISILI